MGAEKQLRAFYKVEEKDGQEKEDDDEEEQEDDNEEENAYQEGMEDVRLDEGKMGKGFEADGGVTAVEEDSRQVYLTKLSRGEISVSSSPEDSSASSDEEHEGPAESDEESDAGVFYFRFWFCLLDKLFSVLMLVCLFF